MKKSQLVVAIVGICGTVLLGGEALSAPVGNLATKGLVQFTPDNNEKGDIIKPDEEGTHEEIITGLPGNSGVGSLRIQFVPDLNFGIKKGITANEQRQNAQLLPYKSSGGTDGNIPPFVQVTNNTGETDLKWTLFVKGTPFAEADAKGDLIVGGDVLEQAYISLKGSTLTTTNGTTTEAAALASGQTETKIPMSATDNGIVVLNATKNSNGKQVSNIFENGYQYGKSYTGEATGVEFVKPAGKAAKKDATYKSTLTWSLVNGK